MNKIITCNLPLPIQRLYIKRLKHMIWRWEYENFCGHCPINKDFKEKAHRIKVFTLGLKFRACRFCSNNVDVTIGHCPCHKLGPKKALKRAKDFVERFEAGDGGKG